MADPLEDELRYLGRHLAVADGPDQVAAVTRRLRTQRRAPRLRYFAVGLAAALVAVFAVSPQVRAGVAHVVRFAGIEVHWGQGRPLPRATPFRPPGPRAASVAEAGRAAGFTVRVPFGYGEPDGVYRSGPSAVTVIYLAGAGRPRPGPDGVSLRIDEFGGTLDPAFSKSATEMPDYIQLEHGQGIWVKEPHEILYQLADGNEISSSRLSGPCLVWADGAVTYRIEAAVGKKQAAEIANSLQ